MSINAKTLIKNKFWIVEENGSKIGTLQKQDDNGWIFLSKKDQRQVYHTQESLFDRFGVDIFENDIETKEGVEEKTVDTIYDFPVNTHPYNAVFDVQKKIPIYTKARKSKSQFCAGYYIIKFPKGWRKAYCPKVITLERYEYKGPMKSKIEMQQVLNEANKNYVPTAD